MAAAMLVLGLLTVVGALPTVEIAWSKYPEGICCRLLITPICLGVLLLGGEVRSVLGCQGPLLFLDKTCISQDDPERKRKGIRKLGAFLMNSSTMVVLYTDLYLQRLWTVYEVASFLSLHPVTKMCVVFAFAHLPLVPRPVKAESEAQS